VCDVDETPVSKAREARSPRGRLTRPRLQFSSPAARHHVMTRLKQPELVSLKRPQRNQRRMSSSCATRGSRQRPAQAVGPPLPCSFGLVFFFLPVREACGFQLTDCKAPQPLVHIKEEPRRLGCPACCAAPQSLSIMCFCLISEIVPFDRANDRSSFCLNPALTDDVLATQTLTNDSTAAFDDRGSAPVAVPPESQESTRLGPVLETCRSLPHLLLRDSGHAWSIEPPHQNTPLA